MFFSVIIPVFNAQMTLNKCLTSVLHQTYGCFELIAIDDGSSDSSLNILKEYSTRDSRVNVFTQKNIGPGLTRNRAIDLARGDYFVFLDSDDYLEPDYLDEVNKAILKEGSDVVIIDNVLESTTGRIIRAERLSKYAKASRKELIAIQMTGLLPWGGWRKVVAKRLIIDNGIRYSEDPVGEEAIFSFDVLRLASKVSFLNKIVYHYVDQPNSQSKKGDDNPWGDVFNRMFNHLKQLGVIDDFKNELTSFEITSICVSIYRIAVNHNFLDAKKLIKQTLCRYDVKSIRDYYSKSLDLKTKVIFKLAKYSQFTVIIFLSKIKKNLEL